MAQRVITKLIDDLDGNKADETVEFGLDGKSYEIDLSGANADKLRGALTEYVNHARKPSGSTRKAKTYRAGDDRVRRVLIRAWARENGFDVGDKGRITRQGD